MSREVAVVTLEIVSPSSKSDGVFPMLLGVGCSAQDLDLYSGSNPDGKN